MRKVLLIIFHSQSGRNTQLAKSIWNGAKREVDIDIRLLRAVDVSSSDLNGADALIIGAAENFGHLQGQLGDMLSRSFYASNCQLAGKPVALFSASGNNGSKGLAELQQLLGAMGAKCVQEPLLVHADIEISALKQAEQLGEAMANALAMGII